jgi:hypothetical protein
LPQLIVCPQLLVTFPHLGFAVPRAQVWSSVCGVQQMSGLGRVSQIWPAVQQMPLQQVVLHSGPGPLVTGVYWHWLPTQLLVWHWRSSQSPVAQQLPARQRPLQQTWPSAQGCSASQAAQQAVALPQSRLLTVPSARMVPHRSAPEKLTETSRLRAPVKSAKKRQAL